MRAVLRLNKPSSLRFEPSRQLNGIAIYREFRYKGPVASRAYDTLRKPKR